MDTIKLKYCIYMAVLMPLSCLPLFALYVVSDILYFFIFKVFRYRRDVIQNNIMSAFPHKSTDWYKSLEKRFCHHFCDIIVETLKLLHISDDEIDRRIKVFNSHIVEELASGDTPIVALLGHLGNWEWCQAVTRHYTINGISGQIYRPLHDKAFDMVMLKIRSRFDTVSIPQRQALRSLLAMKAERRTFLIGFISDQHPNSDKYYHWTTFLNRNTAYVSGAEVIGNKIGASFVFVHVCKPKRGFYEFRFEKIVPDTDNKTNPFMLEYMRMLEANILEEPTLWLWSHRRWLETC